MATTLLNIMWLSLLVLLSPWLAWRTWVKKKRFGDWREKLLGQVPNRSSVCECVWFHAVSVGEVLQLPQLVAEIRRRRGEFDLVISTTTVTGNQVAKEKFPDAIVVFWPLDFSWAIRNAFQRLRPNLVVLVELELWPNFLSIAEQFKVPVALINGRITQRSVRGYGRIRPAVSAMLNKLRVISVQNEDYASRFRQIGAPQDRLFVDGSIKFDGVETDRNNHRTTQFRQLFQLTDQDLVWVVGSTHAPEERMAIAAWKDARIKHPNLRLLIAPRHAERFDEVAFLIEIELQLPLIRRSQLGPIDRTARANVVLRNDAVVLLDSLGELSACWGLADIAFVGGSLTNRGGQSMIEPAAYGAALIYGPHTANFAVVTSQLADRQAALVVHNERELLECLVSCIEDRTAARQRGERARQLVLESQGATARTVEQLMDLIPEPEMKHADSNSLRKAA